MVLAQEERPGKPRRSRHYRRPAADAAFSQAKPSVEHHPDTPSATAIQFRHLRTPAAVQQLVVSAVGLTPRLATFLFHIIMQISRLTDDG